MPDTFEANAAKTHCRRGHPFDAANTRWGKNGSRLRRECRACDRGRARARRPRRPTPGERFWAKVDVGHPLGCWEWTASRTRDGYGMFRLDGRNQTAHRVAFMFLKGQVPDGLELDHLCRVRHCVNPDHLEPVTTAENQRRGAKVRKRRCAQGHEFTPENTILRDGKHRQCRTCSNAASRDYKRRRRAAELAETWPRLRKEAA